jgi:GxxExxY protein
MIDSIILPEESYKIIGICMEVHNELGPGFLEIVYKDALEIEFKNAGILFSREQQYCINYKGTILEHYFFADFVVFNQVVLEVKGLSAISKIHTSQALNYLKASNLELALVVNFGESKLNYQRVVL